jgi:hypothetical protein
MTRPLLTALRATTAKAIVIDTDGSVVLGSPGPQASSINARAEMMKPVMAQRTVCGRVAIRDPGVRGGRCMTPGSGTSTMNPITTVTTTKNLANSSCIGNRATPPLMLKMVAYSMSCSTEDRIVSCSFT